MVMQGKASALLRTGAQMGVWICVDLCRISLVRAGKDAQSRACDKHTKNVYFSNRQQCSFPRALCPVVGRSFPRACGEGCIFMVIFHFQ